MSRNKTAVFLFSAFALTGIVFVILFQTSSIKNTIFNLSYGDYYTLIDIPFKFLQIQQCKAKHNFIILVHSSPKNVERRNVIRETWASRYDTDVDIFFVIGFPTDEKSKEELNKEVLKHKDFIQGDFDDTYHNLSYKHVMCLKYTHYHCPSVNYLVKVDDDVYVNIRVLEKFLKMYSETLKYTDKILCSPMGGPVLREGKWAVQIEEFSNETYPPYCSGFAIIYPKSVVEALYTQAQNSRYFWVDDAYVSGMVAGEAGVTQLDVGPLMMKAAEMKDVLKPNFDMDIRPVIFGPLEMDKENMVKLHKFVKKHGRKSSLLEYLI